MLQSINSNSNIQIQNCIAGCRKSQKELYDAYSSKMFVVCLRYTKNQADAEDVLQDGFVKLFRNLDKYRGEGSFEGWIRRIFVNTAIEHIRKNKNNTNDISDMIENTIKDNYSNALDNLFEKDLHKITSTLSDGYKTVFNMYAIEGYSHKEIANFLGITESTSKSQFSRAKAILRTLLLGNNHTVSHHIAC
ncbi:MAG: sigma-70 family RNA polymerase sigma factor [Chitinophagaceae bacterium]|nr:sigma-70 family RNA polymerase sigma factor [Chitinophagaceae bacterium]MCW5905219.1 sigma-70 family RNA polymerase sigma factor [Chitinophagaceae bacterium]